MGISRPGINNQEVDPNNPLECLLISPRDTQTIIKQIVAEQKDEIPGWFREKAESVLGEMAHQVVVKLGYDLINVRDPQIRRIAAEVFKELSKPQEQQRRETFVRVVLQQITDRMRLMPGDNANGDRRPSVKLLVRGGHLIEGDLWISENKMLADRVCQLLVSGDRMTFVAHETILYVGVSIEQDWAFAQWTKAGQILGEERLRLLSTRGLTPGALAIQGMLFQVFNDDVRHKRQTLIGLKFEGGAELTGKLVQVNSYGCLLTREDSQFGGNSSSFVPEESSGGDDVPAFPDDFFFVPFESIVSPDFDGDRFKKKK